MLSLEEYRKLANDEIAVIPYPATPNGLQTKGTVLSVCVLISD